MSKKKKRYAGIYHELCELIGEEKTIVLWEEFRGTTINFPKQLYDHHYVCTYIMDNYQKCSRKQLASQFDLTERRVNQIIKEMMKDK